MKRRSFLGFIGGAAAGVTLGELGLFSMGSRKDPSIGGPHHDGLRHETNPLSICSGCSAGCSVQLRLVDGRMVGIKGNKKCPISGGGLCARGASEVEAFYDPDRLVGPVSRAAAGAALAPTTWDAALEKIGAAVENARAAKGGARIGMILSSGRGLNASVAEAFCAELGSAHLYRHNLLRDSAAASAAALNLGADEAMGYDLSRANLILSVDSPFLEGMISPCHVSQLFGIQRRAEQPLELIHISSRMSPTAMRADQWVRCKAGTEITLVVGIARVLLREGLVSKRALESIDGLKAWKDEAGKEHEGFEKILSYAYNTQSVSRETGVPVVTILDVARRFARATAPLALGERLAGSAGVFGLGAVSLLNALVDQIGTERTVTPRAPSVLTRLTDAVLPKGSLTAPPTVPLAGASILASLAGLQIEGTDPPFDLLFLEEGSVLGDLHDGDPAWEMLGRIPLIVSFSRSLDVATELAHITLPATTNYEQTCYVETEPASAIEAVAFARAAMKPLVDARPMATVLLDLAGRAKLPMAAAHKDLDSIMDGQLKKLSTLRRGSVYTSAFHHRWVEEQERAGWWSPSTGGASTFAQTALAGGGWIDPVAPSSRSASKTRFRIFASTAQKTAAARIYSLPQNDDAWLPHDEFSQGKVEVAVGSYHLIPFTVSGFVGQGTPNRPSLLEYAGPAVLGAYRPWVEINKKEGEALHIEEGDEVRLVSEHGSATFSARLTSLVAARSVAVPWGGNVRGAGRFAKGWGEGTGSLAKGAAGAFGFSTLSAMHVRLERVKRGEG